MEEITCIHTNLKKLDGRRTSHLLSGVFVECLVGRAIGMGRVAKSQDSPWLWPLSCRKWEEGVPCALVFVSLRALRPLAFTREGLGNLRKKTCLSSLALAAEPSGVS